MNIWWIRRDLRLSDNAALSSALNAGTGVVPVFILDDRLLAKPAEKRHAFLFASLRALDADLRQRGSKLILRRGEPVHELCRLAEESGAEEVFAEQDISPYALRRDAEVAERLNLHLVHSLSVHPVTAITRLDGKPFTVFTPYSRAWKALPFNAHIMPVPAVMPPVPELPSVELPDLPALEDFLAGEHEANRRLDAFLDGPIFAYGSGRDLLDLAGTSALSPYLRFGMLSVQHVASAARQTAGLAMDVQSRAGCETWLNEIIWREFYQSILYHFPHVLKGPFRSNMHAIPWRNAPQDLLAWQAGLTGYPVVDAGMRQMAATGWMHNRARMITGSFLVKHLLINWQEGERWFMRSLIDGDPAANNGGWQWIAGTGTDATPYFRIFNPILQGKKFDPDGAYVRRWLPELANIPAKFIHTPWELSAIEQRNYGMLIGRDYPAPIVEHNFARQRALAAYSGK
ncbi:MAG TPA: deoxyribodipyrimidine photo-lyase [Longilinea sp.]|nr:deoxyribodipyrimidine photo-lyase [Longilinea sp.]